MFKNYIKVALRSFLKYKVFSIINVSGFAVGIASVVLISLWISEEISFDDFHARNDQIYRVVIDFENSSQASICGALGPAAKEEIPEILDYTRIWGGWECQIYNEANYTKEKGSFADPSILTVFTFPLIEGDSSTALLNAHSIVITERIAQKLFKEESALGKIVQIKNRWGEKEDFEITGIMKQTPSNSHIQFDFLFSYTLLNEWYRQDWAEQWSNFSFFTYLLAQENSSPNIISNKITECYNSHKDTPRSLHVEPLKDVYLNAEVANLLGPSGNSLYVNIFSMIAILLLVGACINYMNLATAKAMKRAKEVGLRKVIGAKRGEIILQNFGESVLLSLLSFPIILLLIELMIPLFNNIIGKELFVDYMNPQVLFGMFSLIVLTGIISGIYPAIYISSFTPAAILKQGTGGLGSRNSFRKVLVVFQFTLSIIVIVSALITSAQMKFIESKKLGFEKENLLYAWVPGKNNDVLKTELQKNPNILNVGASGAQLDWIGWWTGINKWDGKESEDFISFGILEVGYNYLETYKMEMERGRYYSEIFSADIEKSIIINQTAAKLMKLSDPVGKTIHYSGKERTIIGVVKDFHFQSLHEEIGPMLFVLYPQQLRCLGIRISKNDIPSTINYINEVLADNILDEKVEVKFLDDQLNQLYKSETERSTLFFYFSIISIFIASLGLFGLAAYSIEQRKKEIGIRKVLGASVTMIVTTLSREFIQWIIISNIIAIPIAYYIMEKWLQDFAYRIELNLWLFLMGGFIALLIALTTVSYQSIKAATANPVESLRNE